MIQMLRMFCLALQSITFRNNYCATVAREGHVHDKVMFHEVSRVKSTELCKKLALRLSVVPVLSQ